MEWKLVMSGELVGGICGGTGERLPATHENSGFLLRQRQFKLFRLFVLSSSNECYHDGKGEVVGMKQRRVMGHIGGVLAPRLPAVPRASAGGSAREEDLDSPLVFVNMPAAGRQKTVAIGVAVLLVVAAVAIAPFASIQLGRFDAFVPVLQTALSIADLMTAALIFAQYSIHPQRALLAVASGYMFSGSFAFLQTLTFPGGYAPNGLIGDGSNSASWMYVLWHTTFPAAILVYAFSKDAIRFSNASGNSVRANVITTVACVLATVAIATWIVTTKTKYLPVFYPSDVNAQTRFGNYVNFSLWLWGATVLAVLFTRRRTVLDLWLMVALLACMPNFLVAIIGSSVRFTVGWYAARGFVLFSSCVLLTVLILETMFLYLRLASVITLQRRESTNRLLSVDAVTSAIAHELNSPLGAIALNANTALLQLRAAPRDLEGMEDILRDIENDSLRASSIISSIRDLTNKTNDEDAVTSAEDAGRIALRLLKHDLQINKISVITDFQGNLPMVRIAGIKLQQVLLNLVRNAIDAMCSSPTGVRRLRLRTSFDGDSTVLMSIQDSGVGIPEGDRKHIFDPFFTTKPDGMGLGLAISSALLEKSGGKLRLTRSDTDGSTFELAIPTGKPRSAAALLK
jgi:signal transduction histidine kinase